MDKMLRESLEHAVAADGSRDIVAIAFQGDEVLSDMPIRASSSTAQRKERS